MTGVVPRRIGRFTLHEELPGGGMSEVYRATDGENLDHVVVVKLLPSRLADDDEYRDRFLREQQILADLRHHPHIVPVIGSGDEDGQLYLAMEHIDGCDLEALLGRVTRLAPRDAVDVVSQMCEALDRAVDVVHRDVKPGNIMIYDGRRRSARLHAYLLDFGIARPVVGGRNLTRADAAIGSLAYMAPERFVARTPDAAPDRSVDVYGLCCVFFEALTGASAFGRPAVEALVAAHADPVRPRPSAVDPGLAAFDQVVADGLAVDPGDRLPTPRALSARLARALEEYERPAAPVTPPPTPPVAPRSWLLGLPHWIGMGALGAAGAAGAVAGAGITATAVAAIAGYGAGAAGTWALCGSPPDQDREASGERTLNIRGEIDPGGP